MSAQAGGDKAPVSTGVQEALGTCKAWEHRESEESTGRIGEHNHEFDPNFHTEQESAVLGTGHFLRP